MKLLFIILIFLFVYERSNAQNLLWVKQDELAIKKFIKLFKEDSLKISSFFNPKLNDSTKLGLNYYIVESHMPVGYIHIRGTFFYFKDSLVGYKLKPDMPGMINLKVMYKSWYSEIFNFSDSFVLVPKYLSFSNWIQPLMQYDGTLKIEKQSDLFKFYFSTESGIIFGCNNGWGGKHLNCKTYIDLYPELNADKVYLLMFSKNPILDCQHLIITTQIKFNLVIIWK